MQSSVRRRLDYLLPMHQYCGDNTLDLLSVADRLTRNFWTTSWVGFCRHSSTVISGCCSSSEALGVLICLFTLECFGSSSSSKLLNSGILDTCKHTLIVRR
ncbi:hypothetical protein EYF80_021418 [Liparis tanakae]|uniref:Uncharacterized protein n=1 Tax=Liparis tanakae TaxID=230148 RepID=A0A4Z2HSV1_9TELE|nr:hypothetical protein EYF80_021418 [Liparis tanakae]